MENEDVQKKGGGEGEGEQSVPLVQAEKLLGQESGKKLDVLQLFDELAAQRDLGDKAQAMGDSGKQQETAAAKKLYQDKGKAPMVVPTPSSVGRKRGPLQKMLDNPDFYARLEGFIDMYFQKAGNEKTTSQDESRDPILPMNKRTKLVVKRAKNTVINEGNLYALKGDQDACSSSVIPLKKTPREILSAYPHFGAWVEEFILNFLKCCPERFKETIKSFEKERDLVRVMKQLEFAQVLENLYEVYVGKKMVFTKVVRRSDTDKCLHIEKEYQSGLAQLNDKDSIKMKDKNERTRTFSFRRDQQGKMSLSGKDWFKFIQDEGVEIGDKIICHVHSNANYFISCEKKVAKNGDDLEGAAISEAEEAFDMETNLVAASGGLTTGMGNEKTAVSGEGEKVQATEGGENGG